MLGPADEMAVTAVIDDLAAWRECHDCGLFQILPSIADGQAAMCARCNATLRRASRNSVFFARTLAVIAAMLLGLALELPLVDMRVLGRSATSTLFTGPEMLAENGLPVLAVVVLFTLIVLPASRLGLELIVLFGVMAERPALWIGWLFAWLHRIRPWAMVEVFMLGSFVAYTRLRALAHVEVGPAIVAMGGVMVSMVATDATLDREAIWQELEAKRSPLDAATKGRRSLAPSRSKGHSTRLLGCHDCGRIARAEEGDRCVLCRHRLAFRKAGGLARVWALLITATLLYIPANVLPVMTVLRFGKGGPKTILSGVVELAQDRLWPLAALVLVASVIVPIVKLISLVVILVTTHRHSAARLVGRTRLFRLIQVIGRWSMIDIFMLAVLVGVVRFGFIATVTPGMGAAAFCGVVLITMVATEAFDPRLMWDAANREGDIVAREGAPS